MTQKKLHQQGVTQEYCSVQWREPLSVHVIQVAKSKIAQKATTLVGKKLEEKMKREPG